MAWVRLDDDFTDNAKIAGLSDRDFRSWVRLLCYCGRAKDPTVDEKTRRQVAGLTPSRVSRLVFAGLLDESQSNPGVFEVHDWEKYQPKDWTNAERQSRWRSRKQPKSTVTPAVTKPVTESGTPSRAGAFVPVPEDSNPSAVGNGLEENSNSKPGFFSFKIPLKDRG
jgi:hypothetical protein